MHSDPQYQRVRRARTKVQMTGVNMNYIYIVECRDKSLYTGWTTDLKKRVAVHNAGKGAKYTKSRRPVKLVYSEAFDTKAEAMRREYAIKHMSRPEKLKLIEQQSIKIKGQTHTLQ